MAGLLYLPRIFVYHAEKSNIIEISNIFKIMEKKLFYYIMTPAAILTWVSGFAMFHYFIFETWLIIKIFFVLLLTIFHIYCWVLMNKFKLNNNIHLSKFYRIINEIPALILIIIIILVIIKPFN
tara:strand:+ start:74 stop:445 length:372 start_codon:yes stop_codon:yes gene_type:complete